ncbi:MAG: tRNA 2-thiouridine(34) synthase MnmA [Thiohalobacterales bacterium]|nr:tRNA 2-thiouridine(34) synthase MnmA [Thiohalobacterales bacterium]
MSRVVVGLSGGVDSAIAAHLLLQEGHQVSAVFMKNWDEDDDADLCPAAADLADAGDIAGLLGIELQTVSFSAEYWNRVFTHFLAEYEAGRTPSPDIVCNREIKFRAFLDHAIALGADCIATGHYARIRRVPGLQLLRGVDEHKDQTYFLHTLTQGQLARSLFPLGDTYKRDVRKLAAALGLAVHDKKDSTGICFIGERRFSEFLARYVERTPGEIRTLDGEPVGHHEGVKFYTIGQRHGLGIGGRRGSGGEAWYVADKDIDGNILYVVQGGDHPALYRQGLYASRLHWIGDAPAELPFGCHARIRHQQPLQRCTLTALAADGRATVMFDHPQRAVTAGQSVVFYTGEVCLGGGIIEGGMEST